MKKLLALVIALAGFGIQASYADETANINVRISGTHDGRYYLCYSNGCFNIAGANRGKVFSFYNPVEISQLFVLDLKNKFRLYPQAIPSSCNVTVNTNQSMTITGRLVSDGRGNKNLASLRCYLR